MTAETLNGLHSEPLEAKCCAHNALERGNVEGPEITGRSGRETRVIAALTVVYVTEDTVFIPLYMQTSARKCA